jgi:hypothetical protein
MTEMVNGGAFVLPLGSLIFFLPSLLYLLPSVGALGAI